VTIFVMLCYVIYFISTQQKLTKFVAVLAFECLYFICALHSTFRKGTNYSCWMFCNYSWV